MDAEPDRIIRRMKSLVDPIHLVAYEAAEPNVALEALGLRNNFWDGYFAGRAAPLGLPPRWFMRSSTTATNPLAAPIVGPRQ